MMNQQRAFIWIVGILCVAALARTAAAVPVADAGPDQIIPICTPTDTVAVTLDGSGSFDPDGLPLTYAWTWGLGTATGVAPTITLGLGEHPIELIVNNGVDDSAPDEMIVQVVLDQTGPNVGIAFPAAQIALQDGVMLEASASDASGVATVDFYIREPSAGMGTPIGFEALAGTLNAGTGRWEYAIDTILLSDGYYVVLAQATDTCGNAAWSDMVLFSVRNGVIPEVVDLLPPSKDYNAGRTVPIKFALKVPAAVDATQPYVYSEELEIRIYQVADPAHILLHTAVYGDTSADYRLADSGRHYITNFKTGDDPAQYLVEIWRTNGAADDTFIGDLTFDTVPHPREHAAQVHRFWAPAFQRHFYTMNEKEKDKLRNRHSDTWVYEDVAFYAFADTLDPEVLPVHRFFAPNLKAHFYTIVEAEKNKLIQRYTHTWAYEGIAFYAYPIGQQPDDAEPLHRFWSETLGAHFFTTSESEKDKLIANYAEIWTYEGVAWYAY